MRYLESLILGALPPIDFTFAMGALSVAITLLAYAVLLRQIIWGTKRPSPIAWIGFGLCTGVGYLVQFYAGVHAGSWTMGVTAFFCFIVGGASMLKGARKAERLDWISFALGFATFLAWLACYLYQLDQTLAAVLATISDLLLYVPLIRAGWSHPDLDSRMAYFLNTVKFVPAIIITAPFTLATVLYPVALVVANTSMNIMLMLRKSWLVGEMSLLGRVLFVETHANLIKHPERFVRHSRAMAAAYKIALTVVEMSAVWYFLLYVRNSLSWEEIFVAIIILFSGCLFFLGVVSDKMIFGAVDDNAGKMPPSKPGWGIQSAAGVALFILGIVLTFLQIPELAHLSSSTMSGFIALSKLRLLPTVLFVIGWGFMLAGMVLYAIGPNDPLHVEEWPDCGPH